MSFQNFTAVQKLTANASILIRGFQDVEVVCRAGKRPGPQAARVQRFSQLQSVGVLKYALKQDITDSQIMQTALLSDTNRRE